MYRLTINVRHYAFSDKVRDINIRQHAKWDNSIADVQNRDFTGRRPLLAESPKRA